MRLCKGPPAKFAKYNKVQLDVEKETCTKMMADAIKEADQENEDNTDIFAEVDRN